MTEAEFNSKLVPLKPYEAIGMATNDKAIAIATGVDLLEWGAQVVRKGVFTTPQYQLLGFYCDEVGNNALGRRYRKTDLKEVSYEEVHYGSAVLQSEAEATTLYRHTDELEEYIVKNYKTNAYYRKKLIKEINKIKKEIKTYNRNDLLTIVDKKSILKWSE